MNAFPDFSTHGYRIEKELGHNSLGGRVTYLATNTKSKELVAIKQFQFAQLGATWAEYSAYEQEIQVLKKIAHPGIPRYLDDFQTDSGFCMVQEYINAESACNRTFSPPDIKKIAIATLEILSYLQSQKPPVIHRDIKPENLLIDDNLNVYLVDFGFARIGGGNIAASSVVKGTMGFMPPEQMFNRELTKASDLYGLGVTLICLLTGTKSADVGNLIDANYVIHFRHLVPPLQQGWMNWLERMVAPRIQDRYQSAADALAALESLDVSHLPKVRIERDRLKFTATEYGEIITQTLAISNPIPDTILTGRWEVEPHPNDPPHTPYDHSWISFEPQSFESNNIECKITVDTQKLLANKTYKRQIILRANSESETHAIKLQVTTAPLPVPQKTTTLSLRRLAFMCFFILTGFTWSFISSNLILYLKLNGNFGPESSTFLSSWMIAIALGLCFISGLSGFLVAEIATTARANEYSFSWLGALSGAVIGLIFSGLMSMILTHNAFEVAKGSSGYQLITFVFAGRVFVSIAGALLGALIGSKINVRDATVILLLLLFSLCFSLNAVCFIVSVAILGLMLISALVYATINSIAKNLVSEQIQRKFTQVDAAKITFLTAGLCTSLGLALQLFFKCVNQLAWVEQMEILVVGGMTIASLLATAIPLLDSIVFKPKRILANYRKAQPNLIKP
ncbi:MAG: serine/threonine protein kinase [Oscillatoriaceae cyanobacterium Prado104]|jgi:serine/threonine protein kinase|nr:serine/threonine protein kinase [Oscillatoriaceae cyanobacterium Prado104]